MARPIKFRAWCPPVTDGEVTLPGHMDYELGHYKFLSVKTETRMPPAGFGFEHIQQGVYFINADLAAYGDRLMQFTGLLDKNGKKIYEGDIIRRHSCNFVVHFDGTLLAWMIARLGDYAPYEPLGLNGPKPEHRNVIGNVYENPELLPT